MCLEVGSFGYSSAWGDEGQMNHPGKRFVWGEIGVGGNYAN